MYRDLPQPPAVLTIAGSDPSGHAGIQADLKTMTILGVEGQAVVTAVTAQSTDQSDALHPVSPEVLRDQVNAISRDLAPRIVKSGLLPSPDHMLVVREYLDRLQQPYICDPVMASSSGLSFFQCADSSSKVVAKLPSWGEAWRRHLLPVTTLLTPNLPELAALTESPLPTNSQDIESLAGRLIAQGLPAILVKGGHAGDNQVRDYYRDQQASFWLTGPRYPFSCRGTGCTLSAAIASAMARGQSMPDAVVAARSFITQAIAASYDTGAQHRSLRRRPWPPHSECMPQWRREAVAAPLRQFPTTGPRPLGFYPVVDSIDWLQTLLPLGVTTIQLRIKDAASDDLRTAVRQTVALGRQHDARVFINDHWQLAIEEGAYGVHLGQEDLDTADLSRIQKAGLRLGLSTHSYAEACRAATLQPSYIALGPIFHTTCKSMAFGPQGIERIREWKHLFRIPMVAIGGLTLEHADAALAAGADGIAVVSDVTKAPDPCSRTKQWLARFASVSG